MRYDKPCLSIDDQVALLVSRGMCGDTVKMSARLSATNYHRLAAYWHPFRTEEQRFLPGTDFSTVWRRYTFDRHFRLIVLDAIERFEVALRTQVALCSAHAFGPFGYFDDPSALPKLNAEQWASHRRKIVGLFDLGQREDYVRHFTAKYGDEHPAPPIWAMVELIDFGTLIHIYQNSPRTLKGAVAERFGIPSKVLGSWMLSLSATRNICAHHSRLWNRILGVKPKELPADRYPEWHFPDKTDMSRIFGTLRACDLMLRKIAPESAWPSRLLALLENYPDIPREQMGFPIHWRGFD